MDYASWFAGGSRGIAFSPAASIGAVHRLVHLFDYGSQPVLIGEHLIDYGLRLAWPAKHLFDYAEISADLP